MSNCGCKGKCRCGRSRDIVYPVRENVKCTYSDETVRHVHPSHTRVINNHTIRNEHLYPHSTSYENRVREVDVRGASQGPGSGVGGAGNYGNNYGGSGYNNYGNNVGGAGSNRCNSGNNWGSGNCGCRQRCGCRRRRGWF